MFRINAQRKVYGILNIQLAYKVIGKTLFANCFINIFRFDMGANIIIERDGQLSHATCNCKLWKNWNGNLLKVAHAWYAVSITPWQQYNDQLIVATITPMFTSNIVLHYLPDNTFFPSRWENMSCFLKGITDLLKRKSPISGSHYRNGNAAAPTGP